MSHLEARKAVRANRKHLGAIEAAQDLAAEFPRSAMSIEEAIVFDEKDNSIHQPDADPDRTGRGESMVNLATPPSLEK